MPLDNLQRINNGKADFMGRRLLGDTNRRLRTFWVKGGGGYPKNEIVKELLGDAEGQGIFGKEQREKVLVSVKEIYYLRDNGRKEMDAGMKIVADKITSHPELELPIETLAADIYVSKYYLIRKFKSSIGMTPHQFCIQNRIRKSQGLLDEEKTVSRIAAEMGFYDQSHFDKAFQKIVGISPSEYVHSKKQIAQGT